MMASNGQPVAARRPEDEEEDDARAEDEDTGAQIAPIVRLQEVAVTTGEENEDVLLDLKAKLYRYDQDGKQWKERGVGNVKLLKHKETGKVRLVMRQNKTLKICANHLVLPTLKLQEHQGNDKSCVWHAADYADGELKQETFAIRFPSLENCRSFRETIEEITESEAKKDEGDEEADAAANLIQTLSVSEEKKASASETSKTEDTQQSSSAESA